MNRLVLEQYKDLIYFRCKLEGKEETVQHLHCWDQCISKQRCMAQTRMGTELIDVPGLPGVIAHSPLLADSSYSNANSGIKGENYSFFNSWNWKVTFKNNKCFGQYNFFHFFPNLFRFVGSMNVIDNFWFNALFYVAKCNFRSKHHEKRNILQERLTKKKALM